MTGGTVKCWGSGAKGQLGNGGVTDSTTPVDVFGLTNVVSLTAGALGNHTCALQSTGAVKCWGENSIGQLGNGGTFDQSTPITPVGLTGQVVSIAAGGNHTCAVVTSGMGLCWGDNFYGSLGDGGQNDYPHPTPALTYLSGASAVSAGWNFSCALLASGSPTCWGVGDNSQLGNGDIETQPVPQNMPRFH